MPDRKRIIEHIKSALIVLLFISALILLYQTGVYSKAFDRIGMLLHGGVESGKNADSAMDYGEKSGLAQAMAVSVSAGGGHRFSVMYDADRVEEDYSHFSAFLAEALGSAGQADPCDEAEWIRALENESVYIRYFAPQNVSFLARRLGSSFRGGDDEVFAEEFCLYREGDSVSLYYRSGESFFRCSTAVAAAALKDRIGEYLFNDSGFSYSDSMLNGIKGSVLILRDLSSVPDVKSAGVNMSGVVGPLMQALGINEYTASLYTESGGRTVYVDGNSVLRISSSGQASYELSGNSPLSAEEDTVFSALELCWSLAGDTIAQSCLSAQPYMSDVVSDGEGNIRVYFDYLVEGIPVWGGSRHAAVFCFASGDLVSAEFNYRSFSPTGHTIQVLPMYQAAAIASSKRCSELSLFYYDTQDNMECIWVNE